jgi:lysozyme
LNYSKDIEKLTESFEGVRLRAYQDSGGKWTIGYGHTDNVYPTQVITALEAILMLECDLQKVAEHITGLIRIPVSQNEFDAICDFAFNVGVEAFRYSTLLKLLNFSKIPAAAHEFERWDEVRGKVVAGLLKRRIAEENLFNADEENAA